MTSQQKLDDQDIIAEYLITELQMVQQRASQQEQSIATRTNLYIASLSIVAGGVFIAIDKLISSSFLLPLIVVVLIFFAALGYVTLSQVLDSYTSSISLYRRMGRIRRFFIDKNPRIVKYMPFAFGDDRPLYFVKYAPLRGIEAILPLANSLVTGVSGSIVFWIIFYSINTALILWITTLFGAIVSFLAWRLQLRYIRNTLKGREHREKSQGRILFPSDSKIYNDVELLEELLKKDKFHENQ